MKHRGKYHVQLFKKNFALNYRTNRVRYKSINDIEKYWGNQVPRRAEFMWYRYAKLYHAKIDNIADFTGNMQHIRLYMVPVRKEIIPLSWKHYI
jgi:hypothetical protein